MNHGTVSRHPNLTIDIINQFPDEPWDYEYVFRCVFFDTDRTSYVNSKLSRLSLLSMMDEDYYRDEGILNMENDVDMVIQSEYIISIMSQYV